MSSLQSKKIIKNQENPWQKMGDETIILAAQQKSAHELNEIGTFIWERLGESLSIEELVKDLQAVYDVDLETARSDVEDFVYELIEKDLVSCLS